MEKTIAGCFITGTDTDVGKTVVTASLLRAMRQLGADTVAVKPVQTGCTRDGAQWLAPDVELYGRAVGASPSSRYLALRCYAPACSPHLAASHAGENIVAQDLALEIGQAVKAGEFCLVEGAGGILSPLSETETMLDLMRALGLPPLLVVANRLGCISHALACMKLLAATPLAGAGMILCHVSPPKPAEAELLAENSRFLARQGKKYGFPLLAELPYTADLHSDDATRCDSAWAGLAAKLVPAAKALVAKAQPEARGGEVAELDRRCIWHPYAGTVPSPVIREVVGAEGVYIYLADGRRLLDGMSSWWCVNLGYGRADLQNALNAQARRLSHVMFGGFTHAPAVTLARKLLDIAPGDFERVFFVDSGSVSVEVALKMAIQYQLAKGRPHKTRICALRGAYHGDTLGAMSVCDPVNGMHGIFRSFLPRQFFLDRPESRFGELPNAESLAKMEHDLRENAENIAAVILEPIAQGAGGMWFYHPDYLALLRRLCTELDIVLIADEVATGFGRTGRLFACEWGGISPDIICLGKGLTGGFISLAATLARAEIAETVSRPKAPDQPGILLQGPTFMANPLACAVALEAVTGLLDSPWEENVSRVERGLRDGLAPCHHLPGVKDVRVLGAIGVVEMEKNVNVASLQAFFVGQGVWLRPFRNLIYTVPPFIMTDAEVEKMSNAICEACRRELFL